MKKKVFANTRIYFESKHYIFVNKPCIYVKSKIFYDSKLSKSSKNLLMQFWRFYKRFVTYITMK